MKPYIPQDWYWIAEDTSRVFSSAKMAFIPADDETFVAWKADGTPPTRVPSESDIRAVLENAGLINNTVTPRQARLALLAAGLLDQVEATVQAVGGAVKITWEYSTEINRDDPMITALAQSLNLTDAQIDDLFRQASQY